MSEILMKTLDRLAAIHPNYPGTIERDSIGEEPRLRYYPKPNEMIEESRDKWNNAVRSLDAIAIDIIAVLTSYEITIPDGQTDGARVMYWLLKDGWKANRVSVCALTNAFENIRNELEMLCCEVDNGKYPGLTQAYRDAQENMKLAKSEKSYRKVTERYSRKLDTNDRPLLSKMQKWLERPGNH